MKTDAPNLNAFWCSLLIEELARQHVTYIGIAPGSRSTPLALAVAANSSVKTVVHLDERALAYHLLGWARATGIPAAIITTSGTAAANLLPAVAEASMSHAPLILLTADRPPELRDTSANQTMDQVKLFGGYVRWQVDLPCPSPDMPLQAMLGAVDQAVARARWGSPGPVHVNCMFREPLAPLVAAYPKDRLLAPLRRWVKNGKPFTNYMPSVEVAPDDPVVIPDCLRAARRGVIVAGALKPDEAAAAVKLAAHLRWPVLPDIQSGLRLGKQPGEVVAHADLVMGNAAWLKRHQPDAVVRVGGRLVSKRLAALGQDDENVPVILLSNRQERQDAGQRLDVHWFGVVANMLESLKKALPGGETSGAWLVGWQQAEKRVEKELLRKMSGGSKLTEPRLAWELTKRISHNHALFAGNSLPIRLLDTFAVAGADWAPVGTNRGVSGIDGLLATATGFAAGRAKPVTLLIGDLSLMHDLNSLALLRTSSVPVVAVVINNDGGGIFSFLPVAGTSPHVEKFFGLPHGRTFEGAATMFDLPYRRVESVALFVRAYREACASQRSALIEVVADRRTTVSSWRAIQKAVASCLDRA